MPIEILTGKERETVVGQPMTIAVEVTDAAGNLVSRAPVRLRTDTPDALDMDGQGRPYAMTKTNSRGIAEIRTVTSVKPGAHEVIVACGIEEETVTLTAVDTGVVATPGGGAVIAGGDGTPIVVMPPQPQVAAPAPRQRVIVVNLGRR